jgi:DNA-binding helix-hairpin-helix protein with protein kinase domain
MGDAPTVVVDTSRARYELGELLGQGGQGAVYRVRGRDLAVKLAPVRHAGVADRIRENVARVRRLPLQGLHVARPLRVLAEPHVGYVMELMTGMEPLESLTRPPANRVSDFAPWYLETGSIQRRLRLLANTADLLGELHARGMAYGDASPANIFVSDSPEHYETWLIDCDNISQGVSPRTVYTPGYAAPELFGGHVGSDSLTDSWSFAVVAVDTLCALHPFLGDYVHDGPPEFEEQAFRGELPWVDDALDAMNATGRGVPREMVLTRPLSELASQCFSKSRKDRSERPTIGAWAERLHSAADQLVICPDCGSGYYVNRVSCPWCDEPRPACAIANVYLRDPKLEDEKANPFQVVCGEAGKPRLIGRAVVQTGRVTPLTRWLLEGRTSWQPIVGLMLEGNAVRVSSIGDSAWALADRRSKKVRPLRPAGESISLGTAGRSWWWLRPENVTGLHRIVTFESVKRSGE